MKLKDWEIWVLFAGAVLMILLAAYYVGDLRTRVVELEKARKWADTRITETYEKLDREAFTNWLRTRRGRDHE